MIPTILFLNYNADKTRYDRIAIYNDEYDMNEFHVYYKGELTDKTKITKKADIFVYDRRELLAYLSDVLDFVANDLDREHIHNIDVLVPGYPIVALAPNTEKTKDMILRIVSRWSLSVKL